MEIVTSRFGKVQISESDMIHFKDGLLGFSHLNKFVFLDDPKDDIFAWLQSCEDPAVAFPLLEPELFGASSEFKITPKDLFQIGLEDSSKCLFYSIITIPEDPTQMTANLKAPIVVNKDERLARQCVLQENKLAIKEPIFAKLQERVVQNPSMLEVRKKKGVSITIAPSPKPDPEVTL